MQNTHGSSSKTEAHGPLQVRRDALARAALGDAPATRNVLISGAVGTGKKLAARAIADLLRALGASKGFVTTETTLDTLVLDVRRDVSTVRSIFNRPNSRQARHSDHSRGRDNAIAAPPADGHMRRTKRVPLFLS